MKNTGIAIIISLPLALLFHYLFFSKIVLHATLHAFIGMLLFFILLGASMLILEKKK